MPREPSILIPHVDDVACSLGANEAMFELSAVGSVTCGSVMVPPAWFPDVANRLRGRELDFGIHLTLTSESAAFRWRPLSTTDPSSGLLDPAGYLWPTVPELRAHADPAAVEWELRAQIDRALEAGIDVTHLDHHMGAALAPEFVEGTARIARDYALPILFPADIGGYLDVLAMGPVDIDVLRRVRVELAAAGLAVGDRFLMGLTFQDQPDARAVFEQELTGLPGGTTYLSLHCSAPGDIDRVHPGDAHWRIAEYHLFRDPHFGEWVQRLPVAMAGMRGYRDAVRGTSG